MRRYGGLVAVGLLAEILVLPQVANRLRAWQLQIGPGNLDLRRLAAAIEQPHRLRAVKKRPGPDFRLTVLQRSAPPACPRGPG